MQELLDKATASSDPREAQLEAELAEIRRSSRDRWRWWPLIPLVAVALLLVVGTGLTLIRAQRVAKTQWAAKEVTELVQAVTIFRSEVGSFPPDCRTGWPTFGVDETLALHLGLRFMTGAGGVGPYMSMAADRLSDVDGDGFMEFCDPWGGAYVYALRTPAPGAANTGSPPRLFDIASPGPDGVLGGRMVPGKGYVPATLPEDIAAEADNITSW